MIRAYCNCRNEIEENVDSIFEQKYSKYKITYHKFIPKILKIYQILIALYICNFVSLENVEISTQILNRQLFHCNDVETTSFQRTISDWVAVSYIYIYIYIYIFA